ncbi:MAG TPA: hypothetical protein VGR15_00750 [Bacteroidota bacterium]|nr:hypothetical protein [Bacteroidota bacterium]
MILTDRVLSQGIYPLHKGNIWQYETLGPMYQDPWEAKTNPTIQPPTGAIINGELIGSIAGVSSENHSVPENTVLLQNYPNPFNPTTSIKFMLLRDDHILVDCKRKTILKRESSYYYDELLVHLFPSIR